MKKLQLVVYLSLVILVGIIAGLSLRKNFGEKLYDMLDASIFFEISDRQFSDPELMNNVPSKSFASEKIKVRLKADPLMESETEVFREISLNVPLEPEEENGDLMYAFDSDMFRFSVTAEGTLPALIEVVEEQLKNYDVSYDPKWFVHVRSKLVSESDESLFLKGMSIDTEDIRADSPEQALYNAVLYESVRIFIRRKEVKLIEEGSNHLYIFPKFHRPNISILWYLFEDEKGLCSGGFTYKHEHGYSQDSIREAAGYLKTILQLDEKAGKGAVDSSGSASVEL
ncbi:hypothetical protein STSP2_00370 [Anaerohalosphaera lusitana]|uniref:Uncharacterized protein n=1 Tax=Anaerohalosphaera lusitana TaxID=1936003 RepID=A0A1U9NHH8_9BACT|nr:hypothetical protein [Anaerohalosphaera lusitana]AQT67227.1 hypothetical protein STSP2_00370 [Anaerohalosphaera lusitana]